tara:strand:+ start:701 stop:1444 length:744 start_codon:yes stop_codon:yes gene_type:complete
MIELSSREHVFEMVKNNPEWNVLDLGCGSDGMKLANVYADIVDRKGDYKDDKKFVQTEACNTPFGDKEFDFVFALHLVEHIPNPADIIAELVRIGKRGFIEVPTPFFDNFVFGNGNPLPHGHAHWVTFDNVKKEIVFKPRIQVVAQSAAPKDTTFLLPFFRNSMITEIYWENTIEFRVEELKFSYEAGNSDPPKIVDFGTEHPPKTLRPWRPRYIVPRYLIDPEQKEGVYYLSVDEIAEHCKLPAGL